MNRQKFATELRRQRNGGMNTVHYINPGDKHFWPRTYLVFLDTGCWFSAVFLVHSDNEQSAHDEIADYCQRKGWNGYFADEEYLNELRADSLADGHEEDCYIDEQFTAAGNEGRYFANIRHIESLGR